MKKTFDCYAKIYAESFPGLPWKENEEIDSEMVMNYLLSDVGCCVREEDGFDLRGDLVIWYLGCNEKGGYIKFNGHETSWSFASSSFDLVEEEITKMFKVGFFSESQHQTLIEKINEGRKIDYMYDIRDYLLAKLEGKEWKKSNENWRVKSGEFFKGVMSGFKERGFTILKSGGKTIQ
jgi:hypothetical protein